MLNNAEIARRLKDAEAHLERVIRYFPLRDYLVTVPQAQLCIELSAKAVIAYFEEPAWTHDPSAQLSRLVKEHQQKIIDKCGQKMVDELYELAEHARQAAPWHGWSTYGREDKGPVSAVELCTEEIGKELLERAKKSFNIANAFFTEMTEFSRGND